jgi:hypothetical protein
VRSITSPQTLQTFSDKLGFLGISITFFGVAAIVPAFTGVLPATLYTIDLTLLDSRRAEWSPDAPIFLPATRKIGFYASKNPHN